MSFLGAIFPHAGGASFGKHTAKAIRLTRYGCANRPFFHIVVNHLARDQFQQPIEQLGSYDPLPNHKNEILVALNVDRIQYWIGEGAVLSRPCAELLGLAGILPVHPTTYINAWKKRQLKFDLLEKEKNPETPEETKEAATAT